MLNRIKKIGRHLLYAVFSNIIYGLILYHVCTWLAGYSLLYAYLGNLVLIIAGLALDELIYKMYRSKNLVVQLKKEKDIEKNYRLIQWHMDSFVSFKAVLYLFYIVVLVFSQIIEFSPAPNLVGEDLGNFILTTQYSIVLLVALDMLIGQFAKDKEKMSKTIAEFKKNFTESQD